MESTNDTLSAALARHNIELPPQQIDLLEHYTRLLWDWNEKINLTRHTDFEKFVGRDVVDSLAFSRFLKENETVIDVGTGGGVPGIILKIVRPDLQMTLTESVGKKAKVVEDIVKQLKIDASVYAGRAEELLKKKKYDTLVVRAVAPMKKLLEWFKPHWNNFGRLLILKGPAWVEERGEARHIGLFKNRALRKLMSYPLPGTESESVLLLICLQDKVEEYVEKGRD